MKEEERKNVASVIEANSKRVTLQELAKRGNRQFRVISKNAAMELIEAAVEDAIRQGANKVVENDREQIVAEVQDQFQRVSQIQAESEAHIHQQNDLIASQEERIQQLEQAEQEFQKQTELVTTQQAQIDQLKQAEQELQKQTELIATQQAQIEQLKQAEQELRNQVDTDARLSVEREQTTHHQAQALEQAQEHLRETAQREQKATRALSRLNRRLTTARQTITNYDQEIERLAVQIKEDALLIEELRSQVHERENELSRLEGLMSVLGQELDVARQRGAVEPESISQLRGELSEVKMFLKSLENQNGKTNHAAVEEMLQRILEKETAAKSQMEDRFDGKLSDMLGKIDSAIQRATVRAIDRPVEATDVFISKVFDEDESMDTNLESLDMQATTAKQSISNSLDRLKKLRQQASQAEGEHAEKQGTESTDDL